MPSRRWFVPASPALLLLTGSIALAITGGCARRSASAKTPAETVDEVRIYEARVAVSITEEPGAVRSRWSPPRLSPPRRPLISEGEVTVLASSGRSLVRAPGGTRSVRAAPPREDAPVPPSRELTATAPVVPASRHGEDGASAAGGSAPGYCGRADEIRLHVEAAEQGLALRFTSRADHVHPLRDRMRRVAARHARARSDDPAQGSPRSPLPEPLDALPVAASTADVQGGATLLLAATRAGDAERLHGVRRLYEAGHLPHLKERLIGCIPGAATTRRDR